MDDSTTGKDKALNFNINQQNPYPGLFSFREEDKDYFFGRKKEISDLIDLIDSNLLTVIFGQPGVGKTSLLRAGLIPELKDKYFLPVYLRINFHDPENSPVTQVKETVETVIKHLQPNTKPFNDNTLWEYFSFTEILNGYVTPILLFDQFEEVFTSGRDNPSHLDEFVTELADLIENRVPLSVRRRLEKEGKTLPFKENEQKLRVIISVGEDYLTQLEPLYRYIPSLRLNRYRIPRLLGRDAVDAVLKPGKEIIKDPEVGIDIINKIPNAKGDAYTPFENATGSWKTKKIEPFLLNLCCYRVNQKRLEKEAGEISRELVDSIDTQDIVKDYYEEHIARFEPYVIASIEELLVTRDGHRKLRDIHSFKNRYGVSDSEIARLVGSRIIRQESLFGFEYVELIHDVLVPVLTESRDNRKALEQQKKVAALRKKKNRRIISAAAALVVFIMAGVAAVVLDQRSKQMASEKFARQQSERASKEEQKRRSYEWAAYAFDALKNGDRDLSFRLAESAYREDKNNLIALKALLSAFYESSIHREALKNNGIAFSRMVSEKEDFFAAFSPDGKQILTVNSSKALLWNLNLSPVEGMEINLTGELKFRPNAVFSPNGNSIILRTSSDSSVILWDLEKKDHRRLELDRAAGSVGFPPDEQSVVTSLVGGSLRLWDLPGGKKAKSPGARKEGTASTVFSPDGRYILTRSKDKTLRLLTRTNFLMMEFKKFRSISQAASFSPDGKYILIASARGPADLRLVDPGEIINLVNRQGIVRQLNESEQEIYNIR